MITTAGVVQLGRTGRAVRLGHIEKTYAASLVAIFRLLRQEAFGQFHVRRRGQLQMVERMLWGTKKLDSTHYMLEADGVTEQRMPKMVDFAEKMNELFVSLKG